MITTMAFEAEVGWCRVEAGMVRMIASTQARVESLEPVAKVQLV